MGKPHDEKELTAMLSALSGTFHQVITGVALLQAGLPVRRLFCGCTDVYFRECRREDILAYSKPPNLTIRRAVMPYREHGAVTSIISTATATMSSDFPGSCSQKSSKNFEDTQRLLSLFCI